MGFLIFAFRKLTLKKRINQMQFRQTLLSTAQQKIQNQISIMQQAKTSSENALQMVMQGSGNMAQNLFKSEMSSSTNLYYEKSKAYANILKANGNDETHVEVMKAKAELDSAKNAGEAKYQTAFATYQTTMAGLAATNNVINSIFSASEQSELNYLHQRDTALTQEMTSNESQLKLLSAEYTEVEKGEDQEAKNTAPKFGMMG